MPFDPRKLQSFIKAGGKTGQGARTGGKGSVRRKRKIVRKQTAHDDKRLKSTLNKLNVRDIPAIEEVNLFKDDGTVIHFASPKVQASIASNTYVVSGNAETKKLQELLPGIINQLGPDNLEELKKIYASFTPSTQKTTEEDDDDIPELVSNFEEQSKTQEKAPEKVPEKTADKSKAAESKEEEDEEEEDEEEEEKPQKAKEKVKEKADPVKEKKETQTEKEKPKSKKEEPKETVKAKDGKQTEKEKAKEKPKEKEKSKKEEKEKEEEGDEEEGDEEEGDEEEEGGDVPDLVES